MLASMGYVVAMVDGRGSFNRGVGRVARCGQHVSRTAGWAGLAFEGVLKHSMGRVELADQVALVGELVRRGVTDPARVAINGWSYGGYMSLMALAQRSDVFKARSPLPPHTHSPIVIHRADRWPSLARRLRDGSSTTQATRSGTWAHRRRNPRVRAFVCVSELTALLQPIAWAPCCTTSPSCPSRTARAHADGLPNRIRPPPHRPNRLVLVHGLLDENVHFSHTAALVSELIRVERPYVLQVCVMVQRPRLTCPCVQAFPSDRHGLSSQKAPTYYEKFVLAHLAAHL
jgi:hypothetical protein